MKELIENKVAISCGLATIVGFLAGIVIGLNSLH